MIVGNDVTHERVIREAIVLLPGPAVQPGPADPLATRTSANLGFFQQPMPPPDVAPTDNGLDVDIIFRVEEKRTGNINFGASLGQGTGLGGFLGLEEPNLFGQGKRGKLQWQFGRNINDFNLSYTDPSIQGDAGSRARSSLFNSRPAVHRRRPRAAAAGRRLAPGRLPAPRLPVHPALHLIQPAADQLYRRLGRPPGAASAASSAPGPPSAQSVVRDTRIGLPFATARHADLNFAGSSTAASWAATATTRRSTSRAAGMRRSASIGRQPAQLGGGHPVRARVSRPSAGFIFGDAGPFFTELYSMGGVQYGIPLRGYEEFSITPNGYDPLAATNRRQPERLRQVVRGVHRVARRADQPVALREHVLRRRQRLPERGPVRSDPALPRRRRRGGFDLAARPDRDRPGLRVRPGQSAGQPEPGWKLHFRLGNFF